MESKRGGIKAIWDPSTGKIHFNDIVNRQFLNHNIQVPYNLKKYLKTVYGKNWHIPNKKYKWTQDSPSSKRIN